MKRLEATCDGNSLPCRTGFETQTRRTQRVYNIATFVWREFRTLLPVLSVACHGFSHSASAMVLGIPFDTFPATPLRWTPVVEFLLFQAFSGQLGTTAFISSKCCQLILNRVILNRLRLSLNRYCPYVLLRRKQLLTFNAPYSDKPIS